MLLLIMQHFHGKTCLVTALFLSIFLLTAQIDGIIFNRFSNLGANTFKAFPFFYDFTGCDTVSSFLVKRKCSFWDIWTTCDIFIKLGNTPTCITEDELNMLIRFIGKVYFSNSSDFDNHAKMRQRFFLQNPSNDLQKNWPKSRCIIDAH